MDSNKRDRLIAAVVAALFHLVLLLTFCSTYLSWPPHDADDPRLEEDSTEILLVSDYINLGDMITNVRPADAPKDEGASGESLSDSRDMENAGEQGTPAPVVTSENPSPAQEVKKPQPEKQGPTREELEAAEKARREQAARDKINNQMKFGGNGGGSGISGTDSGEAVSGSPQGSAGHDLAGRTIVSWGKNSSRKSGTIRVSVVVNAKGEVIEATYAGGDGAASGDSQIRNRTIAATRATKFSAIADGSRNQKGTITWNFK